MNRKKILIIIAAVMAVIALATCLYFLINRGSDNLPNNETSNTETDQSTLVDEPVEPAIPIDEYLWEKERKYFDLSVIKLDSNWKKHIVIGNAVVSSEELTDISVLPNYFFDDQDTPTQLQTAYTIPVKELELYTDENCIDVDFRTKFTVRGTHMGHNVIVEDIMFVGFTNASGSGLEGLKNAATYNDDEFFGIGNTYKYVVGIIGDADTKITDPMIGFNLTKLVYATENTKLILTFTWLSNSSGDESGVKNDEVALENAILTSIEWVPLEITNTLHSQDNIESFYKYD